MLYSFLLALGSSRGKEDQVSGGSAGRDPDEETGDQTQTLWRAGNHHGQRERGSKATWRMNY